MNQQFSNQRVGVFIDVQNMYYSAKALFNRKVDFGKILEEAVGDRSLVRAFAYVIQAEVDQEQPFFDALVDRGLELRIKTLQTFNDGNKKGDWDVGIAMDAVRLASKLDVVVLVSGDGDFSDMLQYLRSQGCKTEVLAFGQSSSIHLREATDVFKDLSQMTDKVLIRDSKAHLAKKNAGRARSKRSVSKTSPKKPTRPTKEAAGNAEVVEIKRNPA